MINTKKLIEPSCLSNQVRLLVSIESFIFPRCRFPLTIMYFLIQLTCFLGVNAKVICLNFRTNFKSFHFVVLFIIYRSRARFDEVGMALSRVKANTGSGRDGK